MTSTQLLRQRLAAQRIGSTTFTRPEQVVAWLGAIQAQDYLGALWAVGLRLRDAREVDVERALAEGSIVRTWPMRGTLHFVAAADARWLTELLAPRAVAAAASRLRAYGLDEAVLGRARRAVVKALEGGRRLTRPAVYGVLERAKVATGEQRGLHTLWTLAQECLICFGPRGGKQQTFVLFDEWLPHAKPMARDEALAALAGRYFAGHGPATLADFAWWTGLKLADARLAVDGAGAALEERTADGVNVWTARGAPSAIAGASVSILPAFDEFLVGYADRAAAVAATHRSLVDNGGGIFNPAIVVGGRVVGTWKRRLERRGLVFLPSPFEPFGAAQAKAINREVARYARFLGLAVGPHEGAAPR